MGGVDDARIRSTLEALVEARGPDKTICPSEAARALAGSGEDFRPLMDDVRRVAFAMADRGELEVTQRGAVVDGRTAVGPIRLRVPPVDP